MRRWMVVVCAAGLLQACGTYDGALPGNSGREIIGVSTHQPSQNPGDAATATPTQAAEQRLDWQQSQLCSLGTVPVREDVEPGVADQQLVDRLVRCQPYEFSMFGFSFANIVPHVPFLNYGPF
jgi:hypothetical protein